MLIYRISSQILIGIFSGSCSSHIPSNRPFPGLEPESWKQRMLLQLGRMSIYFITQSSFLWPSFENKQPNLIQLLKAFLEELEEATCHAFPSSLRCIGATYPRVITSGFFFRINHLIKNCLQVVWFVCTVLWRNAKLQLCCKKHWNVSTFPGVTRLDPI